MSRRSGFSLPELITAMFVLGLLTTVVFASFITGTRFFYETSMRQSAENELRAIKTLMERDFDMTNFWWISTDDEPTADGQRDAVAMVALNDWNDPVNFEFGTDRPMWNRYVMWYATRGNPGSLVRQVIDVDPSPAAFLEVPYPAVDTNRSDANPAANTGVETFRYLSRNVVDFQVTPRLQNGSIRVRLRLHRQGKQRGLSEDLAQETLEVTMTFKPKNTWPAI